MKIGGFVLGYHGCDREMAEELLAGKRQFYSSKNAYDWLGHGTYFWENNPKRAFEWAEFMAEHPRFKDRVKEPYAIGAVIELGNCLDLTESVSLDLIEESYRNLKQVFKLAESELPANKAAHASDDDLIQRYLDCAVINNVHILRKAREFESFDTVRGAFSEGDALYPGAMIRKKTHIQLCVRDLACVKGVFRVYR